MSVANFGYNGIKGAQILPSRIINENNLIESVQLLYDLLGGAKLGKENQSEAWLCGIKFNNS